jgi:hypothetical protein
LAYKEGWPAVVITPDLHLVANSDNSCINRSISLYHFLGDMS